MITDLTQGQLLAHSQINGKPIKYSTLAVLAKSLKVGYNTLWAFLDKSTKFIASRTNGQIWVTGQTARRLHQAKEAKEILQGANVVRPHFTECATVKQFEAEVLCRDHEHSTSMPISESINRALSEGIS